MTVRRPTQVGSIRRLCIGSDPIRRTIYVLGMVPAVSNFYLGVMDQLGADPQKTLERLLGLWALRFLILSLSITPLRRLGGQNFVRYRRALGLLAFYYAALHLTVYTVLDQGLDLAAIWADIVKRPYITVGMLALVIIAPLAATSNAPMIRRLGGVRWQRLHRLVYAAAAAAAVHFVMVVKSWPAEPLIYAGVVAVLLLFRLATHLQKGPVRVRPPRRAADGAAVPRNLSEARASLDPATP
jgi:sulfoxide reductase heme-binding subunit YedZ